MTPSDAKQILSSYNLSQPADLPDEALDALAFAQSDPELHDWLDGQVQFDREFSGALQSVPIPEGLEASILNSAPGAGAGAGKRPRLIGQRIAALAIAAAVVLLSGLALLIVTSGDNLDSTAAFRERAALFVSGGVSFDTKTRELEAAKDWLSGAGYPVYAEVPERLAKFKAVGCKKLDWDGKRIGLVCFVDDRSQLVHLFIIDREALLDADEAMATFAMVERHEDHETGGWASDDHIFLLVGSKPEVSLTHLLAGN